MRTTKTVRQIIDQVDTSDSLWDRGELVHCARKFLISYHDYYVVRRNRAARQYAAEQELAAKTQQRATQQTTDEPSMTAAVSDDSSEAVGAGTETQSV